jgi:hypothetical protein
LTQITGMTEAVTPFWLSLIGCLALSITFTWVYNASGGNFLAVLLLHTFGNTTSVIFPYMGTGMDPTTYYDTAIAVALSLLLLPFVIGVRDSRRSEAASAGS